jgi:hypothetical protein
VHAETIQSTMGFVMSESNAAMQLVPLVVLSAVLGVQSHFLAKEKGRNVALWTLLGALPFINFVCIWFFVGAANLKLERKVDQLLKRAGIE